MHLVSYLALGVFAVCLLGYHYTYFWVTERSKLDTKKRRINDCVESWLSGSVDEGDHLLVVHQIRNMIMAITFLATTAVLLMGFMLNFADVSELINEGGGFVIENVPAWLIVFSMGFSILNFLLSLRYLTQLTYLVRSSKEKLRAVEGKDPVEYLKKLFVTGNRQYTMGRRAMLYGIVGLSWFLNAWLFIVLTIVLTLLLAYLHDL